MNDTMDAPGPGARIRAFWDGRPKWQRISAISLVALSVLLAVSWQFCFFTGCPDVHQLAAYQPGGAPSLLDRDGKPFADLSPVEGELIRLATLPKHVGEAFIAVEDQRFRDHGAIDWIRVGGALLADIKAGSAAEGSSTITMQLARNIYPERIPGKERTIRRKLIEMRVAQEIEDEFDKDEILELYLNHIYFGGGARGIEAASQHYFGVPASKLALHQAAMLAAMPKAPTTYNPRRNPQKANERRDLVLSLMAEQKRITPDEAAKAKAMPLTVTRRARAASTDGFAPYFVEEVRRQLEEHFGNELYDKKVKVTTTLDRTAQKVAEEELERQLKAVEAGAAGAFRGPRYDPAAALGAERTPYLQGAVVAMEAATGDVLAWVGGRDYRQSRFDRVATAQRQTGSAFKPFVYAAALGDGHTLAEAVADSPLRIQLDRSNSWEPRNFDGTYAERVSLRNALVHSRNVATVRLAQAVGPQKVASLAESAGIQPPIDTQPSMALGTVAVSPLEITSAFTTFASLGQRAKPRVILKVQDENGTVLWQTEPERQQVLDSAIAYLVTDALKEVLTRGTATSVRASGFSGVAAGKTGTTNDGADTWFVGYTPEVVATVWVGFDEPKMIVSRATGGRVAAPVWARLMQRWRGSRKGADWQSPGGISSAYVDTATGFVLAADCRPTAGTVYRELFLQARMPATVCPTSGAVDPTLLATYDASLLTDSEEQIDAGLAPLPGAEVIDNDDLDADAAPDAQRAETQPGAAPAPTPSPSGMVGYAPRTRPSDAPAAAPTGAPAPRASAEPPAGEDRVPPATRPAPVVTRPPAPEPTVPAATPPPAAEEEEEEEEEPEAEPSAPPPVSWR